MEHENANLIFFDSDFSYITSFQKNYVNDRVLLVLVDAKWAKNVKKNCNLKEITHVKPQLQKNKFLIKPMFDASLLDNAPNKVLSWLHYPKGKPTVLR